MHDVVRFDLTTQDNSGNWVSVRLPANDVMNLRDIQTRVVQRVSMNLVGKVGLLNVKPGASPNQMTRLGIGVDQGEDNTSTPFAPPSGGYNPAQSSGWEQPPF